MSWWTIWGGWILSAVVLAAIYGVHRWYRWQERLLRERLEEIRQRRARQRARMRRWLTSEAGRDA